MIKLKPHYFSHTSFKKQLIQGTQLKCRSDNCYIVWNEHTTVKTCPRLNLQVVAWDEVTQSRLKEPEGRS